MPSRSLDWWPGLWVVGVWGGRGRMEFSGSLRTMASGRRTPLQVRARVLPKASESANPQPPKRQEKSSFAWNVLGACWP